jgi:hypothetical protein
MSAELSRLRLRYTKAAKVLHSIPGDGYEDFVEVVGDPGTASYEWLIRRGDQVLEHSDCGYGMAAIALRDGLIKHLGPPEADRHA